MAKCANENCNNEVVRKHAVFCSHSCADTYRKGKPGHKPSEDTRKNMSKAQKGCKKSEEIKEKMSIAHKGKPRSVETRKKISIAHKGKPGHTQSVEARKKVSKAKKGKMHSVEQNKKQSEARIKFILENGNPGGYRDAKRGKFFSVKNQKKIKYDSGMELSAYLLLEQLSKVKSYGRCNFSIPYNFKGTQHKYIPDILVMYDDEVQEVIEIKPKYLVGSEQNIVKFNAAVSFCNENNLKFNVWTEVCISQLTN